MEHGRTFSASYVQPQIGHQQLFTRELGNTVYFNILYINITYILYFWAPIKPIKCADCDSWNVKGREKRKRAKMIQEQIFLHITRAVWVKPDSPDDASLWVLLPLGEGLGEIEEAAGRQHGASPWHGCAQQGRYASHQDPAWRQVSDHKANNKERRLGQKTELKFCCSLSFKSKMFSQINLEPFFVTNLIKSTWILALFSL